MSTPVAFLVTWLLVFSVEAPNADADAGSVKRLSRTLHKAKSEKARISAAVALAKLKDKRATKPLLRAVTKDRSAAVRAMAATALGHLGDTRALRALRKVANRDKDAGVRRRADAAIVRLAKKKKNEPAKKPRENSLSRIRVDAQEAPLRKPTMYVTVKSAADKSRGRSRKRVRKRRAAKVKRLMLEAIGDSARVTTEKDEASRLGLEMFEVDASIVKLDRRVNGKWVEVECEIRLTISNERGKMISFLTGGAKVQVAKRTYKRRFLRQMRSDALKNAVQNVNRDLLTFLRKRKRT